MFTTNAPTSAIILAAGMGSRLHPLTDGRPKPLIEVHGVPILHNALRNLGAVGVRSVTIVVGYFKESIRRSCGGCFEGIDINYVESSIFQRSGSAYSLWLARDAMLSGDIFLLEGDVFFETDALSVLVENGQPDVAAVAPFTREMQGSAVILGEDGRILEFRMSQTASDLKSSDAQLFKTVNLLRFSAATLSGLLVPTLDELIGTGEVQLYTEQLLAHLIGRSGLSVSAARCDHLRWCEIDCEADLHAAEAIFTQRAGSLYRHMIATN